MLKRCLSLVGWLLPAASQHSTLLLTLLLPHRRTLHHSTAPEHSSLLLFALFPDQISIVLQHPAKWVVPKSTCTTCNLKMHFMLNVT